MLAILARDVRRRAPAKPAPARDNSPRRLSQSLTSSWWSVSQASNAPLSSSQNCVCGE